MVYIYKKQKRKTSTNSSFTVIIHELQQHCILSWTKLRQKRNIRTLHLKHCKHTNTHTLKKREKKQLTIDSSFLMNLVTQERLPNSDTSNSPSSLHRHKSVTLTSQQQTSPLQSLNHNRVHCKFWAETISNKTTEWQPPPLQSLHDRNLCFYCWATTISVRSKHTQGMEEH